VLFVFELGWRETTENRNETKTNLFLLRHGGSVDQHSAICDECPQDI
jgi:hypothetical protein